MYKQQLSRKSIFKIITGLGMAAAISGCSSSGSSSNKDDVVAKATEEVVKAVFADDAEDTLAKNVSEQSLVSANGVSLIRSKTPVTRGKTTVSLQYEDASITVKSLGNSATFTKDDEMDDDGWIFYENDEGWVALDGDSVEDVRSGNTTYSFMTPIKGGMANDDDPWDRYYAVLGLETPEEVLKNKANATYSGHFSIDAYMLDDPRNQEREHGSVALQADFAKSKINGDITFDPGANDELKVGLKETDISGNAFATTFKATETDGADQVGSIEGDFAGKFFGNKGQEAGGTIAYDYQGIEDGVTEKEVGAGTWTAIEGAPLTD